MCKDQSLDHRGKPHDPLLKFSNFQSTCPVMSQLQSWLLCSNRQSQSGLSLPWQVREHITAEGNTALHFIFSPFTKEMRRSRVIYFMSLSHSYAVLSGKQNFKKGPDWGNSQISFLLLVTELVRRAIWKDVKILWDAWSDGKCYFHANGTSEKHQLNFL